MADQAGNEAGILADVLPELRKTLASCAAFASHEALAAIFVDPRLRPWQQRLLQVQSVEQCVNQVIDLLHDAQTEQGKNALVLLLHVLKEHEPTKRTALTRLRHALQRGLGDEPMQPTLAGATPIAFPVGGAFARSSRLLTSGDSGMRMQGSAPFDHPPLFLEES